MSLRFGTDGIRGVAFEQLTLELSFAIGRAAASVFATDAYAVGRDTRESGPSIQSALTDGLASGGAKVLDLGVLPTPAIAYASATMGIPAAVVSASHNPYQDNGIKFFASGGRKLSPGEEAAIEAALHAPVGREPREAEDAGDFARNYLAHLQSVLGDRSLQGLSVILDCANGSASAMAQDLFESMRCAVTSMNAQPDGCNINAGCGSTHMAALQAAVLEAGPDVGVAFDGDADRVLLVDDTGKVVDGDQMMALLAIDGKAGGWLKDDTLVLTVMSNLGLRLAMQSRNINVHETPVGDKYVLEALSENGWSLGGEQSGHIVIPGYASTGDGMLTALLVLDLIKRSGRPLSELTAEAMTKLPQVLRNVRVERLSELAASQPIAEAVTRESERLGETGRVLLRPSGTEPLVRVMVEAETEQLASDTVDRLIAVVTDALGKA